MQELKELKDVFRRKNSTLDAMILTTYTSFDLDRLTECFNLSGVSQSIDLNKIWLFQCNPSKDSKSILSKRLCRPNCQWQFGLNGPSSLKCEQCLRPYQQNPPKPPLKCFHPKVWLLRFSDDEQHIVWRMVVSSKNFSGGSWKLMDCFYMTESITGDPGHQVNLSGFLGALRALDNENTPEEKKDLLWNKFAGELSNINWQDPFTFWYHWYQNGGAVSSPWQNQGKNLGELFVLSPFVRDDFRKTVAPNSVFSAVHIYSYTHQIAALDPDSWKNDTFHAPANRAASNANTNEQDGQSADAGVSPDPANKQDDIYFHAKIYIWPADEEKWFMCIGSPNATGSAFSKNTEAAVYFEITQEEKDNILSQWNSWFPDNVKPTRTKLDDDDDLEGANDQFKEATGDGIASESVDRDDAQTFSAEALCRMREEAIAKLSGSRKRSYWRALMTPGTAKNLKQGIDSVNEDYPELAEDKQWTAYCESCKTTLAVLDGSIGGKEK